MITDTACRHDYRAVCANCSDQVPWWREARGGGDPPNAPMLRALPVEEYSLADCLTPGRCPRTTVEVCMERGHCQEVTLSVSPPAAQLPARPIHELRVMVETVARKNAGATDSEIDAYWNEHPWMLRADVARALRLRRRAGTG